MSTSVRQGTNMTTNPNPQLRDATMAVETSGNPETYIIDDAIGLFRLTSLATDQMEHGEDGDVYSIGRGTIRKHFPPSSICS